MTTEEARVDAILLASDADKDSFAAIVNLINDVDTENDQAFAAHVLDINAQMSTELEARESGDTSVAADLTAYETSNDAALAAEINARTSADNSLEVYVDDKDASINTRVDAADLSVTTEMSANKVASEAADTSLTTRLGEEEVAARAAEAGLASDILAEKNRAEAAESAEVSARESSDLSMGVKFTNDLATLQADVDGNEADADAAIAALQADVDGNESDADAAMVAEVSSRISGDVSTATVFTTGLAALQADVDGNEADADAAEASLAADILTEKNRAEAAESAMESRALSAEAALQADVDQNEADADAAIAAEESARESVDTEMNAKFDSDIAALQADVDGNESDADAAIAALQADVDQNESDADAAIAALQADVDGNEADADAAIAAEESARESADLSMGVKFDADLATLQADVDANESDSDAAELSLTTRLGEEEVAARAAEAGLASDIATETSRAEAAEDLEKVRAMAAESTIVSSQVSIGTSTDARILAEEGRMDAVLLAADANKDSFAEIVTLINDVDLENDNALAVVISNLNAEISSTNSDVTTLEAADATEQSRALSAEAVLQADIDQNEVDADAAMVAEVSSRISGDASLQAGFTADLSALQSDVDVNERDADAAEASLASDIDTEESRATAAEGSLATDLSSEASTARAAEGVLTLAVTDEANARAAADTQAATDNADARTALQTTLEGQIETLRTESEDADDSIGVELTDAVATLTSNLDAEISATNADFDAINTNISGLTASLAAEVIAREEGDEALDTKISDIISNTDISAMDGFNEVEDHLERLEDYHMSHLVLGSTPAGQVMDKNATVPNSINFQPMGGGSYEHKVKVGTLQIVMNGQMLHQGVDFDTTGTDELVDMVNFNFDVESDDVFDFWAVIKPDAIEYTGGGY